MAKSLPAPRGVDWQLYRRDDGTWSFDDIKITLLMEIRDELQKLNGLLRCTNFQSIPRTLREIRTYTGRIRPRKRARK